MKKIFLLGLIAMTAASLQAAPKKLLVVTATTGFRHTSIPTMEKVLSQLAKQSRDGFTTEKVRLSLAKSMTVSQRARGFTVELLQQPPGKPANLKKDATEEQKVAYQAEEFKWEETLKVALQKLSPESLKKFDGVVFANTTGNLPIPDQQGFLDWIKAGHTFIGIHSASDTFHGWPEFTDMIGGEFKGHGKQVGVECLNQDPTNPATASLGKVWKISQEEIYLFKNYDPAKVHDLLILDKHPNDQTPGHFGVSWCKPYGQGKVFYTSLGHREDLIDADPEIKDRKNSVEISKAYQAHLLGGIQWALQ